MVAGQERVVVGQVWNLTVGLVAGCDHLMATGQVYLYCLYNRDCDYRHWFDRY